MASEINEFYSTLSRKYIMTVKDIFGNVHFKEVDKYNPDVTEFLKLYANSMNFTEVYMDFVMSKNYIMIGEKYFPMSSISHVEIGKK